MNYFDGVCVVGWEVLLCEAKYEVVYMHDIFQFCQAV